MTLVYNNNNVFRRKRESLYACTVYTNIEAETFGHGLKYPLCRYRDECYFRRVCFFRLSRRD